VYTVTKENNMWTSDPCKRLILEVSPEEHAEIVRISKDNDTTIRGYIYGAVRLRITLEEQGESIRPED